MDELCDHLAGSDNTELLVLRNTSADDQSVAKIARSLQQSQADLKVLLATSLMQELNLSPWKAARYLHKGDIHTHKRKLTVSSLKIKV